MPFNVDKYLDAVFASNPALRNEDAVVNSLVRAAELADIPTPQRSPLVQVQRVDTRHPRTGEVTTEWEVVDTRLPKRDRIVKRGLATEQLARTEAGKRTIAGGAYTLTAVDSDEYFHDTDYELLGNAAQYNVISGCAVTFDAANMTADLAAGAITHDYTPLDVAVASNAYTLVADGSNERWAALCLSSAGAAALVSGDAAASSSVEPTKPEIGDRVLLYMVKIQAAQTIADNCEYKLDKRVAAPNGLIGYTGTAAPTTSTSAVDLVTISKLGFADSIPVTRGLRIGFSFRKTATAAQAVAFGLKINSTVVIEAAVSAGYIRSSATQQAENGYAEITIGPRSSANYLLGVTHLWAAFAGATVPTASALTDAAAAGVVGPVFSAAIPNAAITSLAIRAINGTSNNNAEIGSVYVYVI